MKFDYLKKISHQIIKSSERIFKTDMIYLSRGSFWLTFGHAISTISGLLLSLVFANLVSPETYGTYKYVLSIASILAIPTLSGLNDAVAQAIMSGYDGSFPKAYQTKLRWGILSGLGSLGVAGYYFINGNSTLAGAFLLAAFFLPIMDIFNIYGSILYGKKDFRRNNIYFMVTQIISTSSLILTIFINDNIFLILLSYFAPLTITRYILLKITLRQYKLNDKTQTDTISYGKHLSLMNVIGVIASQIDKILVFKFMGPVELAIYSFAVALPEQIRSLSKGVFAVAFPKFAEIKDEAKLKESLRQKTITVTIIFGFIVIAYIIAAPFIYKIFFPQYLDAVRLSQLYSIGLLTIPAISILSVKYTLDKNVRFLYWVNTFSGISNIILSIILIGYFGLIGAIMKNTISWVLLVIINCVYFWWPTAKSPTTNHEI